MLWHKPHWAGHRKGFLLYRHVFDKNEKTNKGGDEKNVNRFPKYILLSPKLGFSRAISLFFWHITAISFCSSSSVNTNRLSHSYWLSRILQLSLSRPAINYSYQESFYNVAFILHLSAASVHYIQGDLIHFYSCIFIKFPHTLHVHFCMFA